MPLPNATGNRLRIRTFGGRLALALPNTKANEMYATHDGHEPKATNHSERTIDLFPTGEDECASKCRDQYERRQHQEAFAGNRRRVGQCVWGAVGILPRTIQLILNFHVPTPITRTAVCGLCDKLIALPIVHCRSRRFAIADRPLLRIRGLASRAASGLRSSKKKTRRGRKNRLADRCGISNSSRKRSQ